MKECFALQCSRCWLWNRSFALNAVSVSSSTGIKSPDFGAQWVFHGLETHWADRTSDTCCRGVCKSMSMRCSMAWRAERGMECGEILAKRNRVYLVKSLNVIVPIVYVRTTLFVTFRREKKNWAIT